MTGPDTRHHRCQACHLPAAFPGTDLSAEGVCKFCRDHKPLRYRGDEALRTRLKPQPEAPYDCIVPTSGGKDSTYTLWYIKKKLGLRPLAVHFVNPLSRPLADENIRRTCEVLGVDLSLVPRRNAGTAEDSLKASESGAEASFVRNFFKAASPFGISWGACTFCHYGISGGVYQEAKRTGVKNIVWSNTAFETMLVFPDPWETMEYQDITFNLKDHAGLTVIPNWIRPIRKNATPGNVAHAAAHLPVVAFHAMRQRLDMRSSRNPRSILSVKPHLPPGHVDVLFYQYIPWNGTEMVDTIERELGWQRPRDRSSTWRFDCAMFPLNDWQWYRTWGFSFQSVVLSCLVREGLMSLDEMDTLVDQAIDPTRTREDLRNLFEVLGLPESGIEPYLELPPGR